MIDLFGRKRIAELEADKEALRRIVSKYDSLFWALHHIHGATQHGKSGTAKKVAKMALDALEGRT